MKYFRTSPTSPAAVPTAALRLPGLLRRHALGALATALVVLCATLAGLWLSSQPAAEPARFVRVTTVRTIGVDGRVEIRTERQEWTLHQGRIVAQEPRPRPSWVEEMGGVVVRPLVPRVWVW